MNRRIGLYARYSDTKQDDGYSIEYQLSECQSYLSKTGETLTKTYIDQAITGTKVAGREAFFELIQDVKHGLIDVILVYKFNRIFRNSYESHKYRKLFKKHGVKLISITQQVDDETSSGRLMISVLADIDEYQSSVISDHVKSAMREMAAQGQFTGGTVPYGYKLKAVQHGKKQRKKYVPDEFEKEIVNEIFELYANNYSLRYLQTHLKNRGAFTRRGKHFSIQTIARMLRNDFYIGVLRYSAQGHEPIVVHDVIPPIIDKELWDRVQHRHSRQKDVRPRKRKDLYSLTGKIHCANCGNHFFGIRSGSVQNGRKYDYKYYCCSESKGYQTCSCKRIRKDYLDDIVLQEIMKNILNEKSIYHIANDILKVIGNNPDEQKNKLKSLKSQQSELRSEMKELINLRAKRIISDAYLSEHITEKETQLSEIEQQIYRIEQQTKNTITHTMIVDYLNKMLSIADNTDDEILKTIFDNFVDSIVVGNDSIDITLIVSPHGILEYSDSLRQPKFTIGTIIKRGGKL